MKHFLEKLIHEDSGQDLIEFALATALLGLLSLPAMKALANSLGTGYGAVGTSLTNAVS